MREGDTQAECQQQHRLLLDYMLLCCGNAIATPSVVLVLLGGVISTKGLPRSATLLLLHPHCPAQQQHTHHIPIKCTLVPNHPALCVYASLTFDAQSEAPSSGFGATGAAPAQQQRHCQGHWLQHAQHLLAAAVAVAAFGPAAFGPAVAVGQA